MKPIALSSSSLTAGLLLLLFLTCACNAKIATVLESDAGSAAPSAATPPSGAACTSDEECNDDPKISSLHGTCVKGHGSGTCACTDSFYELKASGKCGPKTTTTPLPPNPHCTFGQDQSCNDAIEMAAVAGKCNADGTCTCVGGYAKLASGKCGVPATTTTTTFPDYVAGTWLIGWSGGLDHFSWVHLEGKTDGEARFLSKSSNNGGVTPYFNCDGVGTWAWTAKPNTIFLYFPQSCAIAPPVEQAYTFQTVSSNPSTFVQGALLEVAFEHQPTQQALMGFKFPEGTCNTAFTSCSDPFQ
jgi:hypothetical protein